VPPEKAGVASALSETSGELGGALGIALLGSMATWLYRLHMTDVASGVSDTTLAQSLRTSLPAAREAVSSLPDVTAAPLLEAARAAFMSSFHISALLAALALLALAYLARLTLASVPAAQH
jgi:DHA2 family multidrug resistance protein-like MFS transporter